LLFVCLCVCVSVVWFRCRLPRQGQARINHTSPTVRTEISCPKYDGFDPKYTLFLRETIVFPRSIIRQQKWVRVQSVVRVCIRCGVCVCVIVVV
jgi:hypothetical protein